MGFKIKKGLNESRFHNKKDHVSYLRIETTKTTTCNGLSTTSYSRNTRNTDYQNQDHFGPILGVLEGLFLPVCFWPWLEMSHLAKWVL